MSRSLFSTKTLSKKLKYHYMNFLLNQLHTNCIPMRYVLKQNPMKKYLIIFERKIVRQSYNY